MGKRSSGALLYVFVAELNTRTGGKLKQRTVVVAGSPEEAARRVLNELYNSSGANKDLFVIVKGKTEGGKSLILLARPATVRDGRVLLEARENGRKRNGTMGENRAAKVRRLRLGRESGSRAYDIQARRADDGRSEDPKDLSRAAVQRKAEKTWGKVDDHPSEYINAYVEGWFARKAYS